MDTADIRRRMCLVLSINEGNSVRILGMLSTFVQSWLHLGQKRMEDA